MLTCYEWEIGCPKCENWVIPSRDELYKTSLGYIWLDRKARDLKGLCQIIKTAIKDSQRQISKKHERKSFDLVKQEWGKELCIDRCNMKELG